MNEPIVEKEITHREEVLVKKLNAQTKLLALLAVLVLLSCIVVIVQYRQNRIQRAQNQIILYSINDCTKPGGECYEAGARTRILLENETRQVTEHRDRNEALHDAICRRQDETADFVGMKLTVKCPPKLEPHTDSE